MHQEAPPERAVVLDDSAATISDEYSYITGLDILGHIIPVSR